MVGKVAAADEDDPLRPRLERLVALVESSGELLRVELTDDHDFELPNTRYGAVRLDDGRIWMWCLRRHMHTRSWQLFTHVADERSCREHFSISGIKVARFVNAYPAASDQAEASFTLE